MMMSSNIVHCSNEGCLSEDSLCFSAGGSKLSHIEKLCLALLELVAVDGVVGALLVVGVHGENSLGLVDGGGGQA